MPFSVDTGMTPDIIINPCALPSRMTIAHLVECVAAKTGVILGKFVNGAPFRQVNVEKDICDALHGAGYQRHGNERMISGITGEMMEASIFMGPTFYQRLKHMTNDKVHSRSTGPHTVVTRQPSEGRSHNGGLRLGEMERDCLVSHGASGTLQERYLFSSDAYSAPMCNKCGILAEHAYNPAFGATVMGRKARCRVCGKDDVGDVIIPYPYKLLQQELGAMGISVRHSFSNVEEKKKN
jgi:DNA-directed RNA polymerase II subunit RPB2